MDSANGPHRSAQTLASTPAGRMDRLRALAVAGILLVALAATAPFAALPVAAVPSAIVAYDAAIVVLDIITAVLLWSQYRDTGARPFLALACGFAFTPIVIAFHGLSFPDAFVAGSLLGGGQTTAWLWVVWHGAFPLFVVGYALTAAGGQRERSRNGLLAGVAAVMGALALAAVLSMTAVVADDALPRLMLGSLYFSSFTKAVLGAAWGVHLLALVLLAWKARLRGLLDLWIAVVLLALLIDLLLSALLITGRFQVGFYAGRVYGLLAALVVLGLLLREAMGLHTRVARARQEQQASERNYRILFDAIDAGFCTFEMIFDEAGRPVDFRYIETNAGFERQTGRRPRPGQTMREVFPEATHMWLDLYAEVTRTGEAQRFVDHVGGLDRWYDVYVFPIGEPGRSQLGALFTDVTEQKHADAALRESEQKFRSLFETMGQGYCELELVRDAEGRAVDQLYLEFNPAFERIFGVPVADAKGRKASEVFPGLEDSWTRAFDRVATTGVPERIEHRVASLDRWFEVFTYPGDGDRLVVLYEEITERKQAEEALTEEFRNTRILQDLAARLVTAENSRAIYEEILTAAIEITRAKAGTVQMVDPATDELVTLATRGFSRRTADHFHRVDARSNTSCGLALRTGERSYFNFDPDSTDVSTSLHVADGVLSAQSSPLVSRSGKPIGMVSTHWAELDHRPSERELRFLDLLARQAADLLEQRAAEAVLRESEEKFRTLFDSIDEGLAISEMIYDDRGEIVDMVFRQVNLAYERQGGVSDVVGRSTFEVLPGVETYWLDCFERVARTGEPVRMVNYQQDVDRWFEVYFARIDAAGRFIAIVFNDISERKRTEEVLRASEERQRFMLALGDAMRAQPSARAIVEAAAFLLAEHLNPSRVLFAEFDNTNGTADIFHAWTADGATPFPAVVRQEDFARPILDDLRAGRTMRVDDARDPPLDRPDLAALGAVGVQAILCVPLIIGGRLMATLSIHQHDPRHWTDEEVSLLQEVAERLWADVVRARTEEALRASEERLLRVIETPTVGVLFFTPDGVLADANDTFLRMTGYTREQAESRTLSWRKMTPPQWIPASEEQVRRMEETGRFGPYEKEYYRADGSLLWLLFAGRDLGDGTFVEFAIDITEQKRAQAALRESEERLRQFGEASQDILWIRDAETLQWTYLTPAFEKIYGLSREEALTGDNYRNWLDLVLPEDRAGAHEQAQRIRNGETAEFEYRIRRPSDGKVRWLRNTDFPIRDDAGRVGMFGGVGQDVTERKHDQERLTVLVAELQHRVRNILAVVRSVFSRTADTAEGAEELIDHFRGRLDSLARTQVAVTRDRDGMVDLESLIRDELLSVGLSDGPQLLIHGPDVDLPASAAETFALAIHELTTNAIKYGALTSDKGKITIRWSLNLDYGGEPRLLLTWLEEGVPAMPKDPARRGFGTELIEDALPYRSGAETSLDFLPGGLRCIIEMPLPDLSVNGNGGSNVL